MSRFGRISAMVVTVGLLISSTLAASEFRFEFEHWYGQSLYSENGRFESCTASLHNFNDQLLLVRFDRDFELSLGVFDDQWTTSLGDTTSATVWLDHNFFYAGHALAIPKDGYFIQLAQPHWRLNLMRNSQQMLIQIQNQSVLFELEGVDSALNSLIACVNHGRDQHSTI